jgi:hypothetical protein
MGKACSTHGADEKYTVLVRKPENLYRTDYVGDPDLDDRKMLKHVLNELSMKFIDWTNLAQDMVQWGGGGAVINTVMNLQIS